MKFLPTTAGWIRLFIFAVAASMMLIPVHVAESDRGTAPTVVKLEGDTREYGTWGVAGIIAVNEEGKLPLGTRLLSYYPKATDVVVAVRDTIAPYTAGDASEAGDIQYSNEVADLIAMGEARRLLGEDPGPAGLFVTDTNPGCSWFNDGLREKDMIITGDGYSILFEVNTALVSGKSVAENLTVLRDGAPVVLTLTDSCDSFPTLVDSYGVPGFVSHTPASTGSSRGLIVALSMVDASTDGDLTGGLRITGTGEIFVGGDAGPISGAAAKVAGAHKAGFDVFIVNADDYDEAAQSAALLNTPMQVVSADSLSQAVEWLCSNVTVYDTACVNY